MQIICILVLSAALIVAFSDMLYTADTVHVVYSSKKGKRCFIMCDTVSTANIRSENDLWRIAREYRDMLRARAEGDAILVLYRPRWHMFAWTVEL